MVELSSGKERADQGGMSPSALPHLLNLLEQAEQLHGADVFTSQEHDQLRDIFQAALKRLERDLARPQPRELERAPVAGQDIFDALDLDADPYASDVLDARELEEERTDVAPPTKAQDDTILDALDIPGDVDDPDVLDPREVPGAEEEIFDAVELGDVDESDALDADMLEEYDLDPASGGRQPPVADADALDEEDEDHDEGAVRFVDEGEGACDDRTVYFRDRRDADNSR